jgi:hypothetical protein
MEYLARMIVALVSLLKELVGLWLNGQGSVTANIAGVAHANVGDSISYIFANGVNFITALASEMLRQIGNVTP